MIQTSASHEIYQSIAGIKQLCDIINIANKKGACCKVRAEDFIEHDQEAMKKVEVLEQRVKDLTAQLADYNELRDKYEILINRLAKSYEEEMSNKEQQHNCPGCGSPMTYAGIGYFYCQHNCYGGVVPADGQP